MPIAMEHALERVADKRGLKGEDRDAFIYGTMRKTGWKPKREHKMSSVDISPKVTPFMNTEHLTKLSERLDAINFEDDDKKRHLVRDTVGAAALGGAVYGGISAHDKIRNAGGYGKAIRDTKEVFRGGMTGNPVPNLNLGGKAISYSGHAAMAGKKAGMSVIDWVKKLGKGAIGAINADDSTKLVEMSRRLDELIEFASPWGEYNQAASQLVQPLREKKENAKARYKSAKKEYKDANEYGVGKGFPTIQNKLSKESYIGRGAGIGSATGAVLGAAFGVDRLGRGMGIKGKAGAALLGGVAGVLPGVGVGGYIGGHVRRKEMAAKLDELIEFGTLKKVLAGSAIAGAGATAGIGAMHMATVMHNQKKWAKDAKDKELLKVTNDLYVDKHGAMYDSKHPHVKNCKITELSVK